MTDISYGVLHGVRGEAWEEALVITRPRGRGPARIIDDVINVVLILSNDERIEATSVKGIRDDIEKIYSFRPSTKTIDEARKILKDGEDKKLIERVIKEHESNPFPESVRASDLIRDRLPWMDKGSRFWLVAEAMRRLGYESKHNDKWAYWEKRG